jgi:hypothetical protein
MKILILEWIATVLLVIGTAVNSLGYYPEGPLILIAGGAIWLYISIQWGKTSLVATNAVMLLTAVAGLVYHYWG